MAHARLLIATHLFAAGAGYVLAPRELLETEVRHEGLLQVSTQRVLAAAVESLRAENKLLVYSYKGFASVSVERDGFLFFDGHQDLIVPAVLGYYVDFSHLNLRNIVYDDRTQLITVTLPPLTLGDIAFEPEAARTINGGLLSFSQGQVDDLLRLNYAQARRAFIKQAQAPSLVVTAQQRAREDVQSYLEIPLRAVSRPDVKVVVRFEQSG